MPANVIRLRAKAPRASSNELQDQLAKTTVLLRRLVGLEQHVDESLRQHITRELQRQISGSLSALLSEMERRVGREPDPGRWSETLEALKGAMGLFQHASSARRPSELGTISLTMGLHRLAARMERLQCGEVEVRASVGRRLPEAEELCLYELACEVLTTAARQQQGQSKPRVRICLRETRNTVVLSVADGGTGMGGMPPRLGSDTERGEAELSEALQRIVDRGGTISVESATDGICRVTARLPTMMTSNAETATSFPAVTRRSASGDLLPRAATPHPLDHPTEAWLIPWREASPATQRGTASRKRSTSPGLEDALRRWRPKRRKSRAARGSKRAAEQTRRR